ncbi:hypothetical protein ACHAW5_000402 [Stephanodiscus triporus]|uniref:Uncharacterized protein n=1 Tax=Stephanodiscus triporus TaxID=2934178 RepID=A0ABD3P105_9STRA
MLGGLLSRQAEEEERQRQQQQQQREAAAATTVSARTTPSPSPGPSYQSTDREEEDRTYDDDDDDDDADADDDEDDDDDADADDDEDDDDDDDDDDEYGASSYRRVGENERTSLLGGLSSYSSSRRGGRRRRRRRHDDVDDGGWRTALGHMWSGMRSLIIAIADVDNVWDSPTREVDVVVGGGGGGGLGRSNTNDDNNNNNNNPASRIIYDVIASGGGGGGGGTTTHDGRNNRTAAIFWFVTLFASYAFERSTFKILVDRVGPFRLFSADLILGVHALLTGLGMILGRIVRGRGGGGGTRNGGCGDGGKRREFEMDMAALPLADIGLMAVFDTVYLLLGVISGAHVPPVLTVILVQTTIPLTACFTQCVHPDGRCAGRRSSNDTDGSSPGGTSSAAAVASRSGARFASSNSNTNVARGGFPDISTAPYQPTAPDPAPVKGWGGLSRYHIIGTCMMFFAIFIGLTPAVLSLHHIVITEQDAMPDRTAYNTIVFCLAAVPAAVSQLYKEHTLTRLRQPIDRNALNMVLSVFQLLFAIVVSPLAYGLQGMGSGPGWTGLYPSKGMGENFSHGLECFLGTLDDEIMNNGYPEDADCQWSATLVLLHVLSIIMVGVAIDKLAAATKVMYRGVSMGIIFAVILMFCYQIRDRWCQYGPLVSFFHLTSTAVLIVGAEIYHRVSLVDASFETVYPEIGDLYDEGE